MNKNNNDNYYDSKLKYYLNLFINNNSYSFILN